MFCGCVILVLITQYIKDRRAKALITSLVEQHVNELNERVSALSGMVDERLAEKTVE